MNAADFIKKPDLSKNVLLFFGDERYLLDAALEKLRGLLNLEPMELNLSVIDGAQDIAALDRTLRTMPWLAENRLVIINDCVGFKSDWSYVSSLANIPESTYLAFRQTEKPDKRKSLYKTLSKVGTVVEASELKPTALSSWVSSRAKELGGSIDSTAAQLLIEMCGGDMYSIDGELRKCIAVDIHVTKKVVSKYAATSLEYDVFSLHQLMLAGKTNEALALANTVVAADGTPLKLLSVLYSKFYQMYIAKGWLNAGYSPSSASRAMQERSGIRPYAAQKAVDEASKFSTDRLTSALKRFSEYDYELKTGRVDPEFGINNLLVKIYKM